MAGRGSRDGAAPSSPRGQRRPPRARARPAETSCACGSSSSGERLELGRRRPACASACASSQSASHGLRGSSGPWRYVPMTRPARQPSKPHSPSLPKPATTRPSGSAPGSRRVRPAWFSKPGQRPPLARLELALEQHVADHAPLAGDRLEREEPDARQLLAVDSRGSRGRAAGSRRRRRAPPRRRRRRPRAAAPPSRRGPARRAPARGPGRRRRRRGRARRGDRVAEPIARHLELVAAPARARRASTAMLPRSA